MSRHNRQLNRRHRLASFNSQSVAQAIVADAAPLSDFTMPELHAVKSNGACHSGCSRRGTGTCNDTPAKPARLLKPVASSESDDPMFVVQASPDGKGNWTRVGKLRSDTARKLSSAACVHARENPGVCVRIIKPTDGARAVLRYRWVQAKDTGNWYMGSYR